MQRTGRHRDWTKSDVLKLAPTYQKRMNPIVSSKRYISNKCKLEIIDRYQENVLDVDNRLKHIGEVNLLGFDEATAVKEARRCLVNNLCDSCDLCRYFCPDLCISRNENTGQIEIDYDYCKGCGICAFICPKGAITMVREE